MSATSGALGPSPARRWMTGAGLVVIGLGLLLVASTLGGGTLRQRRPVVPVNVGAADGTDPRAHNSPAVARNPTNPANLVVADRVDSPQYSCALHVTADGGATWEERTIPFPGGEELPARCFAPDVVFDSIGTMYLSFVTLKGEGNSPNAAWTTSSTDNGRTMATPTRALGPLAFQVRLLADANRPGNLYLTWLEADAVAFVAFPNPANPVRFMRSTDGGITWTAPEDVSSSKRQRVVAPSPAQGRDNELFVLFLELLDDRLDYQGAHEWKGGPPYDGPWRLVLARSVDRGETWQESVVEEKLVPTERMLVFLAPSPSLAVDRERGRVFVAYQDGRTGDADVLLWTSTNWGVTFSAPRRVNDTARRDGTSQYLPKLAVAPSGRLDILYYDRRKDPKDLMNEVSLQSSTNGGGSFGPRILLSSRAFDSRVGFGGTRGMPDLGSRLGLLAGDDEVFALWSDTRRGAPEAVRQDVAVAVVDVSGASAMRTPLRLLGGLAVAGGLFLLGRQAVAARRRPAPWAARPRPPSKPDGDGG
ncbi:MAG: sialidase family protein [Acidimicrobiales bacterium]